MEYCISAQLAWSGRASNILRISSFAVAISKSLSKVLSRAGFSTTIVDKREAFASRDRCPEAGEIFAEEYEDVFAKLTVHDSTYVIIVTRGHRDDMRVLRWAATTPSR